MVRRARPQARPAVENFRIVQPGQELKRGIENLPNARGGDLLLETRLFKRAPGYDPSISTRHKVAAPRAKHVSQGLADWPQLEHLSADGMSGRIARDEIVLAGNPRGTPGCCLVTDPSGKASGGENDMPRRNLLTARDDAGRPVALVQNRRDLGVRADCNTAMPRGGEHRIHQQARLNGTLPREPQSGTRRRAERDHEFSRGIKRQGLGGQPEALMLAADVVAVRLTLWGGKNLKCPLARIAGRLARSFLDRSDEGGIEL